MEEPKVVYVLTFKDLNELIDQLSEEPKVNGVFQQEAYRAKLEAVHQLQSIMIRRGFEVERDCLKPLSDTV